MISRPDEAEVEKAVKREGYRVGAGDLWYFSRATHTYSYEQAKNIARVCLIFGLPVSDSHAFDALLAFAEQVETLIKRVERLEQQTRAEIKITGRST